MPSRIIREGWIESEHINVLDVHAERFFLRLCLRADDFGRYHANPLLLKSSLFPLIEAIRSTDIPRWLAACEKAGLLRCYSHDGKPFIEIRKFGQRTRAAGSKFPDPPPDDGLLPGICLTDVSHPRTYSESESESYSKSETKAPHAAPVVVVPSELNNETFLAAWASWKSHRSEIRQPLKPTAEKAALEQFQRMGPERAIRAIRWTIFKGWRGLREPDDAEWRSLNAATPAPRSADTEPEGWRAYWRETFPPEEFPDAPRYDEGEWSAVRNDHKKQIRDGMRKKGRL